MGAKAFDGKLYEHFEVEERLALVLEAMARDDDAECERLRTTCPRKTYTMIDAEFQDRLVASFDAMAVACMDLRFLMGKLHILHWAMKSVLHFGTLNHITAQFAFLEGTRCAEGLNQMDFFRKIPKPLFSEDGEEEEAEDDDDAPEDEDPEVDDEDVDEDKPPTPEQIDRGRRMDAVEKRAEYSTDCVITILTQAAEGIAGDLIYTWEAFGNFCRTRVGIEPTTLLRAWGPSITDNLVKTIKRFKHVKADPAKVAEYEALICKGWDRRFGE